MRVYRCIKLQEVINKYKNENNKKIENPALNTHIYESEKEYIHFFRYDEFAKYYFNLGKDGSYERINDNYVLFMTANIPKEILDKYKGFGFYDLNYEEIIMPEYAIPIEEFSSDYIVDITNKPMSFYIRKNENEEYMRYLQLIRDLIQNTNDVKSIAMDLLKIDLEKLIGVKIDDRSEKEIAEEVSSLLLNLDIPKSNDMEIQELEFKRK